MMLMVAELTFEVNIFVEAARHEDHVSPILAGAEDPIDVLRGWIVAADDLIRLRREIEFAAREIQSVSGMQRAEIDGGQRLAGNQIDDGDRVQSAVGTAVVRDVGEFAVVGGDDFVGIGAGGDAGQNLQCGGIDDRDRVVALRKNQESG